MRKPGGQPGHEGKTREFAGPEQVSADFEHLGAGCGCGHRFDGREERLGEPVVQHKWELPVIAPEVVEHRLWRLACPVCGKGALAALPDGVSGSALGPRLEAHIAVLAGVYRLSRRQIADIVTHVFGCPISVGTVDAAIMRMSRTLATRGLSCATPFARPTPSTPMRRAGACAARPSGCGSPRPRCWPVIASTNRVRNRPRKHCSVRTSGLRDFVITDPYAGYHWLDVLQQQLCWAHAIRQFTELSELSERSGAPGKLGRKLLGPFHVIQLATDALDEIRREVWNEARHAGEIAAAKDLMGAGYALWKNPENLTDRQQAKLADI